MNLPRSPADDKLRLILIEKILLQRGIDLRIYKENFLRRRFEVRMMTRKVSDYKQYLTLLENDPAEYLALFDALSINVTEFFRDKEVFDGFATHIIPKLLTDRIRFSTIRIWSAGCATGEEAYTLAIIFAQKCRDLNSEIKFKIIGSDMSAKAIETAKKGTFPISSLKKMPPKHLAKYFNPSPTEGYYQIQNEIKDSVSFTIGNLATSTPPSNLDAIFCRNAIIYFGKEMQQKLFTKFFDALKPKGYLTLGKAETILDPASALFEPIMPSEKIYRKR